MLFIYIGVIKCCSNKCYTGTELVNAVAQVQQFKYKVNLPT